MCLFPIRNTAIKSKQYRKGLVEFDCGACPECLAKRSRLWALRCSMEAREGKACMVTLTYDSYIRDESGRIIGEQVAEHALDKKDAQDFLKRLRSYYDNKVMSRIRADIKSKIKAAFKVSPVALNYKNYREFRERYILSKYKDDIEDYKKVRFEKEKISIKYLLTAERGKSTNRPHYHAILFGIDFAEDRAVYKKSKRGNTIFTSNTLSKLWNNGICTVDCVNVSAKVARYCTKYCVKDSRANESFMLVSRGIGDDGLLKDFNGYSYLIDGREYPIPKLIWNKVIQKRYSCMKYRRKIYGSVYTVRPSYKYKRFNFDNIAECDNNRFSRRMFQAFRDSDKQYKRYLEYWHNRSQVFDFVRGSVLQRLAALPNDKYFSYKQAALKCYERRFSCVQPIAPRANARVRFCAEFYKQYGIFILEDNSTWVSREKSFALTPSCHIRANDIKKQKIKLEYRFRNSLGVNCHVFFSPRPNLVSPFG